MARSGGGGNSNMIAMAAQRDAMNQKVIDALEKLSSELQASRGAGGGGGGSGGVGGGAGGAAAAGPRGAGAGTGRGGTAADRAEGQAWAMNAKVDSAKGDVGVQAVQQVLTSSGMGGLGSLVSGGLAGFAGTAIKTAASFAEDQRQARNSVAQSGSDAYAHAPVNSSEAYKRSLEREAKEIEQLHQDRDSTANKIGDWFSESTIGELLGADPERSKHRGERTSRAESDVRFRGARERSREEGARGALTHDFEPFANVGMRVPEGVLKMFTKLRQKQADARQAIQDQISAQPGWNGKQ